MTSFPATHCPYCGTPLGTRQVDGRDRQFCTDCDRVVWRNPVPCAGVAVVSDAGVLLTQRDVEPGIGEWAVPGGHMEVDETAEAAAARELEEETGVDVDPADLELLDQFTVDRFEHKRILSVGFAVRRERTTGDPEARHEVADVGWFTPTSFADTGETLHDPHDRRFERAWQRLGHR